ncbi:putative sensor/response regulator hybrid protein [Magnetofaba australis IT-1]|uniref:Putative sensor/response regulator hybrid protein n=2 Tax=Magnetofaba TaxID=1472292 RepID=A0A1Y2K1B8_9PROT|nr:putative sensor/response regulator hybrid protein [Magnetofaba australis IT-1]
MREFLHDHIPPAQAIRELLTQPDGSTAAQAMAHRVRGIAGNISAHVLFDDASALEKALISQADDVEEKLSRFENALERTAQEITKLLHLAKEQGSSSERRTAEAEWDADQAAPELQALRELIIGRRFDAEAAFAKLKPNLLGAPLAPEQTAALEIALDRLDYDGALAELDAILQNLDLEGMH